MTAKPVPEHISDERLAEVRRLASVEENDCLRDGARSAAQYHADVGSALTELQHRREAEAGAPEGWVLVPREPTIDMASAGWDAIMAHTGFHEVDDRAEKAYRAMLAASPSSPASVEGPKHATSETAMRECLSKISALAHDWMTDAKLTVPRARQTLGDIVTLSEGWSSSPASGVRVSVEGILEMLETAQRLRADHLPNSTQQAHLWEKKAGHAVRELIAREAAGEPFGPVYWPDELRKALGGYRAAHLSALGEHP